MDAALRSFVRERAGNRCEYCGILQAHIGFAAFHIDHIIPRQHGGTGDPGNLALACYHCNLHKGPNLTGIDPDTGVIVQLFHPRQDTWHMHFALQEVTIVGLTPTGRAPCGCYG
jgi:predicted restriction endonuclease